MRTVDIIAKKRDGGELLPDEIEFLIKGYAGGEIPDYQMAAWAMAVFFQGMTAGETAALTAAMANSGQRLDLSAIPGVKVDKHSTGGVGDKTTLVLAPLVAAAGVPVAKMSGRGLGHTGGTLDKLESIPGFRVSLDLTEFLEQVREIGVAIAGQTLDLAPADKKLYALRDVTASVESLPLIASSVMSKKIASGADAIVLDVKVGEGAFVKTLEQAVTLSETMVGIGNCLGRTTTALITDMNQPLGWAVGNALEVEEAIRTLAGQGPPDLIELCFRLGSEMLLLAGRTASGAEAEALLRRVLEDGSALAKLEELIRRQGGNPDVTRNLSLLPRAADRVPVPVPRSGFVSAIKTADLGRAAVLLGAGRRVKEDPVDPAVGLTVSRKIGDRVTAGEPLAVLSVNDRFCLAEAVAVVKEAFVITADPPRIPPLVYGRVTGGGVELYADAWPFETVRESKE